MAVVPAFQLGLWNAWIFMLAYVMFRFIPTSLVNFSTGGKLRRMTRSVPMKKSMKILEALTMVFFVIAAFYTVFLPLKVNIVWLSAGIFFFLVGMIIGETVTAAWVLTPPEKPHTRGIYRFSRHPLYLSMFIQFLGIGVASASWVFILFSLLFFASVTILVVPEEHHCLELYGKDYQEYLNRTPRWLGFPRKAQNQHS